VPRLNLTRDDVIRAAARLADDEGFDAVSVSAVARLLGVQPASLYGHVRDRAALLDGIHRSALAELAERIAAAVAGRAGRDAIVALADAHRGLALSRPGVWSALQRPAGADTIASPEAARVATLTLAVLRGYGIPESDLVHATRFVAATINGYLALQGSGSYRGRDESEDASWLWSLDARDRALRSA
jgi:AcrR family transcriptional regulator